MGCGTILTYPINSVRNTVTTLSSAPPELETAQPAEIVAWALGEHRPGRVAVVTALQREGMVVVDLALRIDPGVRIVTIDTGRLPAETQAFLDTVRAHYGRDIEVRRPAAAAVTEFVRRHGPDAFYIDPELRVACCALRKVAPRDVLLGELDCWLTGLRRSQSASRAATPVVDRETEGLTKVNPLVACSADWVSAYIRDHGVPEHPLYAEGYTSIGCAPCTRATRPGEDERAGRWWWESGLDTECGMHGRPALTRERLTTGVRQ